MTQRKLSVIERIKKYHRFVIDNLETISLLIIYTLSLIIILNKYTKDINDAISLIMWNLQRLK